jgi:hypothetical protein
MANLFADENVPFPLVEALRLLGQDVLTAQEAGLANQSIPDPDILAHATGLGRAVLTNNRKDFHRLHQNSPDRAGIITFTHDPDTNALADRIHAAIPGNKALIRKLKKLPGQQGLHQSSAMASFPCLRCNFVTRPINYKLAIAASGECSWT